MNELTLTSDESQFSMRVSLLQLLALVLPCDSLLPSARPLRPVPLRRAACVRCVDSWYDSGVRLDGAPAAAAAPAAVAAPAAADADEGLISYDTLSDDFKAVIDLQLAERNKERILSGQPKYESIADFAAAYMEYEGKEKGLSLAECESEVLRFLQRRALLSEGALDGDAQDYATFGLLAVLLAGAGFALAKQAMGGS